MADRFCRVTLTRPTNDPHGLTMTYGYEDAIPRTQLPMGALSEGGIVQIQDVKLYNPGAVYIEGKPITYGPLVAGDLERASCLMSEATTKHFFGDWLLQPGMDSWNPRLTFAVEKDRVARIWGGYKMKSAAQLKRERLTRDTTKTGPPDVPHVLVHKVDGRGIVIPDFEYDPWLHFGYATEVYVSVDEGPAQPAAVPQAVAVDYSGLAKQIREQVLAEIGAANAKSSGQAQGE